MDKVEIEAVYEGGTLKLPHPLPLREGQKVSVTIHPTDSPVERLYRLIPWRGDREEFDCWLADPDEGPWGRRGP